MYLGNIFIALSFYSQGTGSAGIEEFEGTYYKFVQEKKIYSEAKNYCNQQNGKLFEPKNEAQNEAVRKSIEEKISSENTNDLSSASIWLGINDHNIEGEFRYNSDKSKLIWSKFSNVDGIPNNNENVNCVDMYLENGFWMHKNCKTEEKAFVCEYEDDPATTGSNITFRPNHVQVNSGP